MRLYSTQLSLDKYWQWWPSHILTMAQEEPWYHFYCQNNSLLALVSGERLMDSATASLLIASSTNKRLKNWMRIRVNFSPFCCYFLTESIRIIYFFISYRGLLLMIIIKILLGSCRVSFCFQSLLSPSKLFLWVPDECFICFHWQVGWMTTLCSGQSHRFYWVIISSGPCWSLRNHFCFFWVS